MDVHAGGEDWAMSQANRGKPLERALVRGARYYRHEGRAVVMVPQYTPMHQREGALEYSSVGAPVDLIGGVDGRPWALEAKETAVDRFPLEDRKASQRAALHVLHACGFTVGLVIDFTARAEVYLVPFEALAAFEAAPWRRSLSLDWVRANGLLLREERRDDPNGRRTLFLDGAAHPEQVQCKVRVIADRADHPVLTPELVLERADARDRRPGKRERELRARLAERPAPGTEEYAVYMRRLIAEGTERQLRSVRGKAGKWRGGKG